MLHVLQKRGLSSLPAFSLLFAMTVVFSALVPPPTAGAEEAIEKSTITNLAQLTHAVLVEDRSLRDLRLPVVVCAASTNTGVLIVQDSTGTELLELGNPGHNFQPGDKIRLEGKPCFIRRTGAGILVAARPLFDNDGIHSMVTFSNEFQMKTGRYPFRLDWFNSVREFGLEVSCEAVEAENSDVRHINFLQPTRAECFEGFWESLPDFQMLQPVKTMAVTNLDRKSV